MSFPAFVVALFLVPFIFMIFAYVILVSYCYKKAIPGKLLIRNGVGGLKWSSRGLVVFPGLHTLSYLDTSLKRVRVKKAGNNSVITKDPVRMDITTTLFLKINSESEEDLLWVLNSYGVNAFHESALHGLLEDRVAKVLDSLCTQWRYCDLYIKRVEFKESILELLKEDLKGFVVDDCTVEYLEFTAADSFDLESDIDRACLKNLHEINAEREVRRMEIENEAKKEMLKQDLEAQKIIHELEQQQARAEERQKREIAAIRAQEQRLLEEADTAHEMSRDATRVEEEIEPVTEQVEVKTGQATSDTLYLPENNTEIDPAPKSTNSHEELLKGNKELLEERMKQNEALIQERINRK